MPGESANSGQSKWASKALQEIVDNYNELFGDIRELVSPEISAR